VSDAWRHECVERDTIRPPEIPDARTDVARRAAAAATSVSGERVFGGERQLREITAGQVAFDDDVASRAETASSAARTTASETQQRAPSGDYHWTNNTIIHTRLRLAQLVNTHRRQL